MQSARFHPTYNCKQKAFVPGASFIVKWPDSELARNWKTVIGIGSEPEASGLGIGPEWWSPESELGQVDPVTALPKTL